MSTDTQHGRIIIACDTCDATFEGDSKEWNEVWPKAKAEGWRARQVGNDWVHACPDPNCEV